MKRKGGVCQFKALSNMQLVQLLQESQRGGKLLLCQSRKDICEGIRTANNLFC